MGVSKLSVFCIFTIFISTSVLSHPANENKDGAVGNLKFTFDSDADIPAAFFDIPIPPKKDAQTERGPKRINSPGCRDGSGGMCIPLNQCPANLKPEKFNVNACDSGLECCFGPPDNDKSCGSRGGECTASRNCGGAPTFKEAQDCNTKNGEVCCIYI